MNEIEPPTTLEQLDEDLVFVENQAIDARDFGIAMRFIVFKLLIELHNKQIINGEEFCETLIKPMPDLKPEGAKIALAEIICELMPMLGRV